MTPSEKAAHCLGDVLEDLVMGHGRRAFPLRGRAGGPADLSRSASQPEALIPNARKDGK